MKKKLNQKQQLIAYLLNTDDDLGNLSTKKIGELFDVSQSTAYNAVKEVKIQKRIHGLEQELVETKRQLRETNPKIEDGIIVYLPE